MRVDARSPRAGVCPGRRARPGATAVAALLLAATGTSGHAQDAAGRRVTLAAGAGIGFTATDNQRLSATKPLAEAVVQPSFSLRVAGRGARVDGFVDYGATGQIYTRDTESDEVQNSLSALFNAEVIDNHGFVEVGATVSQLRRSAFDAAVPDAALGRANRTEVSNLRIAPALRGRIGGAVAAEARLAHAVTRSSEVSQSDADTTSGRLAFGPADPSRLGWSAQLDGSIVDFREGRRTTEATLRGIATWNVDSELVLSLIGGRETKNFATRTREAHALWGARARWLPGPRTRLDLDAERHGYGRTHVVEVSHRHARTAVTFSDTRAVTRPDQRVARAVESSAFDVLFLQYASIEPDPDKRRALVEGILRDLGIDPKQRVGADFLTAQLTLDRAQRLSLSWLGVRQTVALGVHRTDSRRVDTVAIPIPGDPLGSGDRVVRRGLQLNVGHRLTPTSSLSLDAGVERTVGSEASRGSVLRSFGVGWAGMLGRRADLAVSARHAESAGASQPYQASIVSTALRYQF